MDRCFTTRLLFSCLLRSVIPPLVGQQITPTTLNPLTPKEPPHFAYISAKPLPTKTETLNPKTPTTLNDLLMNTPAFFGVATLAHAFSIPTKLREFHCTLSCYIYQNSSSAFCPCLQFKCPDIMPVQEPDLQMASFLTLSKHPQCSHILHTGQASYSSQRPQTHNLFE